MCVCVCVFRTGVLPETPRVVDCSSGLNHETGSEGSEGCEVNYRERTTQSLRGCWLLRSTCQRSIRWSLFFRHSYQCFKHSPLAEMPSWHPPAGAENQRTHKHQRTHSEPAKLWQDFSKQKQHTLSQHPQHTITQKTHCPNRHSMHSPNRHNTLFCSQYMY